MNNSQEHGQFIIKDEMLKLLESVGATGQKYTVNQAVQYLKTYLTRNKLVSPKDPYVIIFDDDPMGYLFHSSTINLKDPQQCNALLRQLFKQSDRCFSTTGTAVTTPLTDNCVSDDTRGVKRKLSDTDLDQVPGPMYLHVPPSPTYDSGEETVYSIQEYPTEEAHTSSDTDDSVFSSSSSSSPLLFERVNSSRGSSPSAEPSTILELGFILSNQGLRRKHLGDIGTDVSLWADQSEWIGSSSGKESTTQSKWQCPKCNLWNFTNRRSCHHCEHMCSDRKKNRKRRSRKERQRLKQAQVLARTETSTSTQENGSQDTHEKCIICSSSNANALILHGQTAHNVCCYRCARKLQKRSLQNRCPTCRREIDRVVCLL